MNDEEILCIDKMAYLRATEASLYEVGSCESADARVYNRISAAIDTAGYWDKRSLVETNEKKLQIIPYVIIHQNSKLFGYRRIGGDERLIDKISLGVGGHVRKDFSVPRMKSVENSMWRELQEELVVEPSTIVPRQIPKLLYSDSTPVDRVHLGMLYMAMLSSGADLSVRETENLEGRWYTRSEVRSLTNLESWSILARDYWLQNT